MNAFPWLLRREVWEHRVIFIVPLVFLTLLFVTYTFGLFSHGPGGMLQIDVDSGPVDLQQMIKDVPQARQAMKLAAGGLPFIVPGILLNAVMLFLWFFYLTDSLYAERKDRSVLFWKSLPVSDTTTVVSKLVIAMAVIPFVTFVVVMLGAGLFSLSNTVFAWTIGESAWDLIWSQIPFVSGPAAILYALAVQSLWYAPIIAWLLLASAFARRAPILWALLPPAGIVLLERAVLGSTHFITFIGERLKTVVPSAFTDNDIEPILGRIHRSEEKIEWADAFGSLIDPQSFLTDPGLWGGLVVAAVFLSGAVWLRRYRDAY